MRCQTFDLCKIYKKKSLTTSGLNGAVGIEAQAASTRKCRDSALLPLAIGSKNSTTLPSCIFAKPSNQIIFCSYRVVSITWIEQSYPNDINCNTKQI